jgi:WXG100 family type VII secretion target
MANGNISMSHQEMQQAVADIRARKDELQQFLQGAARTVEQVTGRAYRTRTASGEFRNAHTEWNRATGQLIGSLDEVANGVEQSRRIDEQTDQQAAGRVTDIRSSGR